MTPDEINELIAQCRCKLASVNCFDRRTRVTVDAFTGQLDALASNSQKQWEAASDAQKDQWGNQLRDLLTTITQFVNDGPENPNSEMHREYASNRRILAISLWATLGVVLLLLYTMRQAWNLVPGAMPQEVIAAFPLVITLGALGGFLSCIQSFGLFVGNRQFLRSWTIYYILFPLKGAGLALIVFFLTQIDLGAVNPPTAPQATVQTEAPLPSPAFRAVAGETNQSPPSPNRADQARKKPNLILACLIAGLTGMFSNQAIEMLSSVFTVVFAKVGGKDPLKTDHQNNPPSTDRT